MAAVGGGPERGGEVVNKVMKKEEKYNQSGMGPEDLKRLKGERPIYLWGASIVGHGVCRALERCGLAPAAFLDRSPRLRGKKALGYPVWPPEVLLKQADAGAKAFIIIASGHYEDEIAGMCRQAGLRSGQDFISSRVLSPLDPSVDISGICNLRCISCPRGNMAEKPPKGFMTPATFELVLDKLLQELPFMGNIQLYAWGEPLLHPQVAEIIRLTQSRRVLSAISTNLNVRRDLTEVIQAQPDWLKISASGFGANYELTHTGGKWDLFHRNLYRLQELRERYHPTMYVEMNYHLYRHNQGEDYRQMARLCQELGFVFRPNWAYLYPLDNVLAYCQGKPLSPEARRTLDLLYLDLDQGLARARSQAHLPCAEARCFPIAWNLHVRSCGAFFLPTVVDNFLEIPLPEILRRRDASGICQECQRHALHRFTSVYLEEAAPLSPGETQQGAMA